MLSKRQKRSLGLAKSLRKRQTSTEDLLWKRLRNRAFHGYKFRRQCPIGPWIVDFLCSEKSLVIEIDGGDHFFRKTKDKARDAEIKNDGYCILRFTSLQMKESFSWVLETIYAELVRDQ